MSKKLIIAFAIIVIAVLASAYYCLILDTNEGSIVIGHLPSDHDSAMYVAQAQKQYEAQGLKVDFKEFNNGGDLLIAMASGDVQVGYLGITPVMGAISKDVPIKVIGGAQTEGSALVVGANSNYSSLLDLKGKTIATPGEASIQYMLLKYELEKEGLSISDVSVTSMKVASMCDALRAGKVDAIMVYEPYSSIAVSKGYGKVLMNSSEIIKNHPCCVVVARNDFIEDHPGDVKKILAIHENATNFVNANASDAINLLPRNVVADKEVQTNVLEQTNFIYGLNETYKQSIVDFMDTEVQMGILKKPIPLQKLFANV